MAGEATTKLGRTFRRAFDVAVDALLPPRCPGCQDIVSHQSRLCAACWTGMPVLPAPACETCAEPLPPYAAASMRCAGCLSDPPPWVGARAPFLYDGLARELVLQLKHGGKEHHAGLMAREMQRIAGDWLEDAVIVPVPLHRWRLWRRGFNQAAWIARALATGRYTPDLLLRTRDTGSTKGQGRAARLRGLQGAFAVPPRVRDRLRGRNVVLVDDVLTSGATARACVAALKRAGVAETRVLVYARVARDRGEVAPHGGL